jgi:hypothetical protein
MEWKRIFNYEDELTFEIKNGKEAIKEANLNLKENI